MLIAEYDSEVHKARSKHTGALVALKKIIMHHEKDGVRHDTFLGHYTSSERRLC